ncbi:hypothetical protein EDD86DRAFT_78246 [Gorgonomyces haynaldii]|nr:hypothetical protein EDD86DRAFT_78246 [Gorgonomyces haynaldii]
MPKEKKPEPVRESQSAVSQTRSSSTSQNRHSVESEPKVPVHKKSKSIAALLGEDPAMFEHAMRPGLQDNDKQQTRGSFLMLGGKTKSQSSLDSPRDSNTSNSPRPQKETILERRVEKAGVTISDLKLNIFKHLKKSSSSLAMEAGLNVESMTKVGSSGLEKRLGVSFSPKPNKKEWDESDASNPGSGTSTPNKIVHAQDWKKNTLAKTALTHSSSKLSVVSQDDLPSARSQDSVMDTTLGEHRYVAPKASIERKDDYLVNTPKEDAVDRKQAVKTSPKASPGHLDSGYVKSGTKQAFGSDEQLYAQDISKSFQDMAYIVNPLPSPGAEDPTDALTRILEQKPDRSDPLGRILQDNYEPQIRSPKTEKITRSTQLKQVTSWMNCKKNAETEFVHRYIVVQDGKLFIFTSDTQVFQMTVGNTTTRDCAQRCFVCGIRQGQVHEEWVCGQIQ